MCSTGCITRDHRTYGECMRSKGGRVLYANSAGGRDFTAEKKWNRELDAYADAKRQGIQPSGTTMDKITNAVAISDATGSAYQA